MASQVDRPKWTTLNLDQGDGGAQGLALSFIVSNINTPQHQHPPTLQHPKIYTRLPEQQQQKKNSRTTTKDEQKRNIKNR